MAGKAGLAERLRTHDQKAYTGDTQEGERTKARRKPDTHADESQTPTRYVVREVNLSAKVRHPGGRARESQTPTRYVVRARKPDTHALRGT
jgi:hypothetical protein